MNKKPFQCQHNCSQVCEGSAAGNPAGSIRNVQEKQGPASPACAFRLL